MRIRLLCMGFAPFLLAIVAFPPASAAPPSHGISYFGDLKYPKDFPHFDYANPDAPKGGRMRTLGMTGAALAGTFNNLHPYVDKGTSASGIGPGFIYDALMIKSQDELASYYGNLAESVEVAGDYSWVAYTLRQNAYWHDGVPLTVEDVIWTFETLKTQGSLGWKAGLKDIIDVEKIGPRSLRFNFSESAEKTPQLAIQTTSIAILPKHYWANRRFNETTLDPPLGSGPYRIKTVDPGHRIVYERVEDYWGKDVNVNIGAYNFDEIEFIYFFDKNLVLQAIKADVIDYKREFLMGDFATAYDFWGVDRGLFIRERLKLGKCYGMNESIAFNTRKEKLKDIRVREALTIAYDFEWSNRVLWHDARNRNDSYFIGTGMVARGLPSSAELELLEPFRGQIPERVFTEAFTLPVSEGHGRNRDALRRADALLNSAGWVVKDFKRVHEETGEPLTLEFITSQMAYLRMLLPYVESLERLGIEAKATRVEINQLGNRLRKFDFEGRVEMIWFDDIPVPAWMRSHFLSRYVDEPYMTNYSGINDPAVDDLVEKVLGATTIEEMNTAGRALDRVLLWGFYLVPIGYPKGRCFAYWDRFGYPPPETMTWNGWPHLWWLDEEKSARVDAGIAAAKEN